MNLEALKKILVDAKIFVSDKPKNYICRCVYCGDHRNPKKQGHLYVSKKSDMPVAHCWYCGKSVPIPVLIKDITGDSNKSNEVISKEELDSSYKNKKTILSKKRFDEYKVPQWDNNSFLMKREYIRKRTNNQIDINSIPNLILDPIEFFHLNHIDVVGERNQISNQEAGFIRDNFIGFLGNHNSILYCRNIDDKSPYKFKKVMLQIDTLSLLDYWCIKMPIVDSNTIVLTEGNFNALGEYITDSLKIKDSVKIYASGNSFSYSALLKSVCFDLSIFKADVIILGDDDKKEYTYKKFLEDNDHLINSCKVYVNRSGKDFGVFPQKPIQIL